MRCVIKSILRRWRNPLRKSQDPEWAHTFVLPYGKNEDPSILHKGTAGIVKVTTTIAGEEQTQIIPDGVSYNNVIDYPVIMGDPVTIQATADVQVLSFDTVTLIIPPNRA